MIIAAQVEAILSSKGYITDIGQLSPCAKRLLKRLVSQGRIFKDYDRNYPLPKTCYVVV